MEVTNYNHNFADYFLTMIIIYYNHYLTHVIFVTIIILW